MFSRTKKRSEKREAGRRAQLLSVDFLVAVSILTVCMGAMLQFNEFSHSRAELAAFLANNKAESIAALIHDEGVQAVPSNTEYCARRVLLTQEIQPAHNDCATFSCNSRGVFSARRLESCIPSPAAPPAPSPTPVACVLEVRTC